MLPRLGSHLGLGAMKAQPSPVRKKPDTSNAAFAGGTGPFCRPRLASNNEIVRRTIQAEDESGQKSTATQAKLYFASIIRLEHQLFTMKTSVETGRKHLQG